MNMNILNQCILSLSLCLLLSGVMTYAENEEMIIQEYRQHLTAIKSLARAEDMDELKRIAHDIESQWGQTHSNLYAALVGEMCTVMSSVPHESDEPYTLMKSSVMSALAHAEDIQLDVTINLLHDLLYLERMTNAQKPHVLDEDERQQRVSNTRLWLRTWQELQRGIDTHWDSNDLPLINVAPPDETGLPSGTASEHITDPELRKRYEQDIKDNIHKAQVYAKQLKLRELEKQFFPQLQAALAYLYSKEPYELKELEEQMKNYMPDEILRKQILGTIKQNIGQE